MYCVVANKIAGIFVPILIIKRSPVNVVIDIMIFIILIFAFNFGGEVWLWFILNF